jgi:hypothetical protein
VAQSRLAGRPPTLLPTAKYRPPDGTFSHRFTVARSQSPFGTAQARSLFDEPTPDEPNGDAAADEAEQGEDAATLQHPMVRRTVVWSTLASGLQRKEDVYSLILVRIVAAALPLAPFHPRVPTARLTCGARLLTERGHWHCPAPPTDCLPDPNSVQRPKPYPRLPPTALHVPTQRSTPDCPADVWCTPAADCRGRCMCLAQLPDCRGPLCWMQGTVEHAELPADAEVHAATLRHLQCCELIRKGSKDPKTSVKEGLKKWFAKCGDGYSSCDCAFQIVEHHVNENGMWVPAGRFSLQWNGQHHDHTCVSCLLVFVLPVGMNAACSLSTKKVHPALKKLVQEHAEILSPMYAESAVRDL